MRLKNKIVLITGGTSGIGRATVELFVAEGAQVAFTGRRSDKGLAVAESTRAAYIQADHRLDADCRASVEKTVNLLGPVDILFNNAGIVPQGTAETTTGEIWEDTLALNVTGVWRMSKYVLPMMRNKGGVIINNASDWGVVGARNAFAYAMSKGAVIQMTRSMALDYAHENIRVNAVCPGDTFVERWLEEGYFAGSKPVTEAEARDPGNIPLGRVGSAMEIARAVLFLASEDSSYMTGQTLIVDGGNTAQ